MSRGNLALAARRLGKDPLFTLAAVATLALGIGASTAVFSVTNAVLLRPLPYADPNRLVLVWEKNARRSGLPFFDADFFDLRSGAQNAFEDFAAINGYLGVLPREDGTPDQVRFASVSPNFFRLLGAHIAFGRDFFAADGRPQPPRQPDDPGYDPHLPMRNPEARLTRRLPTAAILSYEFWQRRYGGNPAIVGRGLGNAQVVGILAPHFEVLLPPSLGVDRVPDVYTAGRLPYDRRGAILRVIGRMKAGATLERARLEAHVIASSLRAKYRTGPGFEIRLEPLHAHLVAQVRPALLALMGAAVFLLLIACTNMANLMLVRASQREREFAVRAALGGTWRQLADQVMTEALLLAGLGTALGAALAWAGIQVLLTIAPPGSLPRLDAVAFDWRVLAFAVGAGVVAAAAFGSAPAWRAGLSSLNCNLRSAGHVTGSLNQRLNGGIVAAGVALSFVLLTGSGLMFRSFLTLQRVDPGYDPHNLLTFRLQSSRLILSDSTPGQRAALMHQIDSRLRTVPGVRSVTASSLLPLAGTFMAGPWGTDQLQIQQGHFQLADVQLVLPGYFEAMRTRLVEGRSFSEAENNPEHKVAVIDEPLAAKAFPREPAAGKHIFLPGFGSRHWEAMEVVGVVAHQRASSLADLGREQIYLPDGFGGFGVARYWALRTAGNPAKYSEGVRAAIRSIDPHILILDLQPMETLIQQHQAGRRYSLILLGVFATVAVLLASMGLYGVLASLARERTREIGVRMALGAAPVSIFRLIIGHGVCLSLIGIAIGTLAALALTRAMSSMLVGITPTDPVTFAAMALVFLLIAAAACWLPAHSASAVDPAEALRSE